MAITRNDRGFGISKYGIELLHTFSGFVKEVSGGEATSDVVVEKLGSDALAKKHLGPLRYEEIMFKCGSGMTNGLYDWIQTGFNQRSHSRGREDGAVIYADYDNNEVSRLTWTAGLITEFGMPALDASSKDSAMMTIKFSPETTKKTWGGGGKVIIPSDASKQKKWLPSNFHLKIDGCEVGCTKVNKIEALTIKQKVTENAIGELRNYQKEPTSVEVPNLVVTLAESHADEFYRWHEDFVINGNNGQSAEKGATLHYLLPNVDKSAPIFTLEFYQLGIFKITPDKVEAGAEPIRRVKVEMYCEEIKFSYAGDASYGMR